MIAVAALEAREGRLFPIGQTAKEGLIGLLQPGQHILQNMAMDGTVLGQVRTQVFQLGFLRIAREGHATLAVEADALLQSGVVERATAPQDRLKLTLLDGRWLELLLIRLAARRYRLLAHGCRL